MWRRSSRVKITSVCWYWEHLSPFSLCQFLSWEQKVLQKSNKHNYPSELLLLWCSQHDIILHLAGGTNQVCKPSEWLTDNCITLPVQNCYFFSQVWESKVQQLAVHSHLTRKDFSLPARDEIIREWKCEEPIRNQGMRRCKKQWTAVSLQLLGDRLPFTFILLLLFHPLN